MVDDIFPLSTTAEDSEHEVAANNVSDRLTNVELEVRTLKKERVDLMTNIAALNNNDGQLCNFIQERYERLEVLLQKVLVVQNSNSSASIQMDPSRAEASMVSAYHPLTPESIKESPFDEMPVFDGSPGWLISWLDEMNVWTRKLGFDARNDLLFEPGPPLIKLLKGPALIWFESNLLRRPFSSFIHFQRRLLEHTFRNDWSLITEKFVERCRAPGFIGSSTNYLDLHGVYKDLLMYGKMDIIKEVLTEIEGGDRTWYICDQTLKVICQFLKKDMHYRAIDLLEAIREAYAEGDKQRVEEEKRPEFESYMNTLIEMLEPEKNNTPIKRFLTLCKEELNNDHKDILETFCFSLVYYSRNVQEYPILRKFLLDFIGQRSLLTSTAFAKGFLYFDYGDGEVCRSNFLNYCWRQAVVEGLKDKYSCGGEHLWNAILNEFPGQFPPMFPPSEEVLATVLDEFKTKQDLEKEWAERNAPMFSKKLEGVSPGLSTNIGNIISKYAVTWIDTLDTTT